jgi:CheY-like chemotaxis protein
MRFNEEHSKLLNALIDEIIIKQSDKLASDIIYNSIGIRRLVFFKMNDSTVSTMIISEDLSFNEAAQNHVAELARKTSYIEISAESTDENGKALLDILHTPKAYFFANKDTKGPVSCILSGVDEDYAAKTEDFEFLKFLNGVLPALYRSADTIKEDYVILKKRAEIYEEEKTKLENEYIKTCKNKEILEKGESRYQERIKALEDEEQNLYKRIAELNQSNSKLTNEKADFEKEIKQLQNEKKTIKLFAKTLSNALHNPANKIVSLSEKIGFDAACNNNGNNYSALMQEAAEEIQATADRLSDLALSEDGKNAVSKQKVDLNLLLQKVEDRIKPILQKKQIRLSVNKIPEGKTHLIISDKEKLSKIFRLILRCYIENKETKYIKLRLDLRKEALVVLVESDASCIDEIPSRGILQKSDNAFESISEANKSLNFFILNEYINLFEGTYSIGSLQNKGSYLKVHIPYEKIKETESNTDEKSDLPKPASKPKGEKQYGILIAEDEEINFMLLETLLTDVFQLNPLLYHAENGREAVDLYRSQAEKIDLILMDLKMPELDGFSATQQIRELQTNVPIIAQTAYNSKEYKVKAAESGCNDLISKPISRSVFRDILIKHLGIELK